jgi:hypothetical protein
MGIDLHLCSSKGCKRFGTHHLQAKVWAKGYPRDSHDPLTAEHGMQFCEECAKVEAISKATVNDAWWTAIEYATQACGFAMPDRDSLEFVVVEGLSSTLSGPKPRTKQPTRQ